MERILDGTIRIPGFQRTFVWEPDRSAALIDSLFKGYPVGSVLLWRTRTPLRTEKRLGGFELPPPDKDYPVDYVLDGQQRLTTIFATFQTALDAPDPDPEVWLPIYYDFEADSDAQQSQFVALNPSDADDRRHFALNTFFEPVKFSRAVSGLTEDRNVEIVREQQSFVEALLAVETFESEDRASVAIVFERVNRMGVPLDIFQLLTAWTWSEDFDLQQKFEELAEELGDFGFQDVGTDSDLMLRCCAAILLGDPSPTALVDVSGATVRADFDRVATSIRLAIDFVRDNLEVRHLKFLPYSAQLIPLAAFFSLRQGDALQDTERRELLRWFWRSSFSHRYSGNPGRNIKRDVEEALKLRNGETTTLADIVVTIGPSFFTVNRFASKNVATKTFVLMLASLGPRSFLSGAAVKLDVVLSEPNRSEYHHCYPKAALRDLNVELDRINALANFAIISRSDNRTISNKAPSVYRGKMPTDTSEIQAGALIPDSLFVDDFDLFIADRIALLDELRAKRCDA